MYSLLYVLISVESPRNFYCSRWPRPQAAFSLINSGGGGGKKQPDTVEPPKKGHFGDNINSAVSSFIERLSSSRRFSLCWNYRKSNFLRPGTVSFIERSNIQCPFFGGSTIGGSTSDTDAQARGSSHPPLQWSRHLRLAMAIVVLPVAAFHPWLQTEVDELS